MKTKGLLDIATQEIGDALLAGLPWLENWYGLSERIVEGKGETNIRSKPYYDIIFPAFYERSENRYKKLFPSNSLGNYGYLDVDSRVTYDHEKGFEFYKQNVKGRIVLWWDYRKLDYDWEEIYATNIEDSIVDLLVGTNFKKVLALEIIAVNRRVQEIFDDYDHKEVEQQFAIRPYGLVGIDLKFKIDKALCSE